MPTTLKDAGAKKEDIPKLLKTLEQNLGQSFGSFKTLTIKDAEKIYELAWE